jgi:hypothetical protein
MKQLINHKKLVFVGWSMSFFHFFGIRKREIDSLLAAYEQTQLSAQIVERRVNGEG